MVNEDNKTKEKTEIENIIKHINNIEKDMKEIHKTIEKINIKLKSLTATQNLFFPVLDKIKKISSKISSLNTTDTKIK